MKIKLQLIILVSCLTFPGHLPGQSASETKDKYTMLTMPYIGRPLTLYKGQIQANAGYKFALRSRSFDNDGYAIDLKENGNASVMHYYFMELKYGVLDFFELGAETSYKIQGIRTESISYVTSFGQILMNTLNEYKGFGDIFVYGSIRPPFEYKKFDFRLSGGIYLPAAKNEPGKPTHSITDFVSDQYYTINYQYNNRNGYGVMLWQASASAKFTFSKFAAEASFTFRDPLKEGKSLSWDETLTDMSFSYTSTPFTYLTDRMININLSVHYQPVGWFNIYLNSDYSRYSDGWTEYSGLKYSNPEISLLTLEPGYEIVVSPSFRLSQTAGFALAGNNTDAPFFMITTLSYNIFPFRK